MNLLLNNKKRIILSPHYDDLPLSIGGLVNNWKSENIITEDWVIFSLSNYVYSDENGNNDLSNERIEYVSNKRYQEEMAMAQDLNITTIKRIDCYEAKFRGHNNLISPSQKKYAYAKKDQVVLKKLKKIIYPLLYKEIDLFIPLGFGGHYDHILVREAVLEILNHNIKATIFFYEDLPYISNINWKQKMEMYFIMRKLKLKKIIVPINLEHKVNLLNHYPSQSDPYYHKGIINHSQLLQKKYRLKTPAERIFKLVKN